MDYLTKKGVERSRMIARGLGKKDPIKPNTSEENMQYNRRTEFRVIGDVSGKRIIYDQNRPEYIDKSGNSARARDTAVDAEQFD